MSQVTPPQNSHVFTPAGDGFFFFLLACFPSAGLEWLEWFCILFSIVTSKTKPPAFKDRIGVQTIGKLPVPKL